MPKWRHVLREVGKKIKMHLEDKIGFSDEVKIELTKGQKTFLQKICMCLMKLTGANSITINLPGIDITFDKRAGE